MRTMWYHKDKSELARRAGCSRQLITDLFLHKKAVSRKMAARIQEAAEEIDLALSRLDCLYPEESKNPLFEDYCDE